MKFGELPYERVTLEYAEARLNEIISGLESAPAPESALEAVMKKDRLTREIETKINVAYIRHTINTADEFYDAEKDYYDEILPQFEECAQRFGKALVTSPHRARMEAELGSLVFANTEMALKTFSPEIVEDLQLENKLTSAYVKLLASAKIPFDGQELTRSQLVFYKEHRDRDTRKRAFEADAGFLEAHKDELDETFDRLVKTRTAMARKLGFDDYIQLGYYQMQRNSYTQDDVAAFRGLVREKLLPLTAKLKAAQAARLGIDALRIYDDAALFADGNALPKGTEIFKEGRRMYAELSPETKEFFDYMLKHELFDVLSRPGKAGGGYCTYIPDHEFPFIFANFNGTTNDIDVLTHEAGHALAAYGARGVRLYDLHSPTYEACEVHSMAMEFFTWPWMELFFDDADKYRYGHLSGAFSFIPYGCVVDEFQHIVYSKPGMTPAERNKAYLALEEAYRPYLKLDDVPFYRDGRRWQVQTHIYERPFYYIDYCLAQTVALHLWAMSLDDFSGAWQKYRSFLSKGGSMTFTGLLESAGLPSPFSSETFDAVSRSVTSWIESKGR